MISIRDEHGSKSKSKKNATPQGASKALTPEFLATAQTPVRNQNGAPYRFIDAAAVANSPGTSSKRKKKRLQEDLRLDFTLMTIRKHRIRASSQLRMQEVAKSLVDPELATID